LKRTIKQVPLSTFDQFPVLTVAIAAEGSLDLLLVLVNG